MYGNMRIALIGRGMNGWHTANVGEPQPTPGGNVYRSTGSSSGGSLQDYLREAPEGTPVYDASECDYATFSHWVIAGPMVDVRLSAGETSRVDKRTMSGMMGEGGLQGAFATVASLSLAGFNSLDYVSVDIYLALLKDRCPGVKVGKVVKGEIVWDPPAQLSLGV